MARPAAPALPAARGHPRAGTHPAPDVIARIKDRYGRLSPAEQSVADTVLADVRGVVEESNAAIAARAGVSEPTVTRFCRTIGCSGVRDFKLQLARSLVVGEIYLAPERHPPATDSGMPPYWHSILTEAHAALNEVERQLDPAAIEATSEILSQARHVAAFGLGGSSSALAEEVQTRLIRYGTGVTALRDPYLARMTVATWRPGDALVTISASGRTREAIETVDIARRYGAATIAICPPGSELAQAADIVLGVQVPEYPDTLTPSASRFALLAVIDLMAAATGYRLGDTARENLRRIKYDTLSRRPGSVLEPLGD
ncbi:MAG: MurR/RpiR family transcriptional regulator [Rubellimicrobium sp.]|nr:MurR/RpiR family transcriptional regulator [Rubellimicrobium sp.]